jgi:hypothetical protein
MAVDMKINRKISDAFRKVEEKSQYNPRAITIKLLN